MTKTLGSGAVWDIAFSTDPEQTFAYVADGVNQQVHVLRRKPLEYLYSFGSGGRMAGQFFGNHSIAVDSTGKRLYDGDLRGQARAAVSSTPGWAVLPAISVCLGRMSDALSAPRAASHRAGCGARRCRVGPGGTEDFLGRPGSAGHLGRLDADAAR